MFVVTNNTKFWQVSNKYVFHVAFFFSLKEVILIIKGECSNKLFITKCDWWVKSLFRENSDWKRGSKKGHVLIHPFYLFYGTKGFNQLTYNKNACW